MIPHTRPFVFALAFAALTGCDAAMQSPAIPGLGHIAALGEPNVIRASTTQGPPDAKPGSCWGREVTPAVIETVTEQIVLQPAEVLDDGTVINPAIYKTETRQAIVRERRETWFQAPCDEDLPVDFTATLQRALQARGHYRGSVSAEMDARTRAAIRSYQKDQGLDSSILSLTAAQNLGLVAVPREAE